MRIHIAALALCVAFGLEAVEVRNLTDDAHLSGPKLKEKDLQGKVIAVEEWGRRCPPCLASLPHMAKLAKSLEKDSRVVFIGSHVQGRDDGEITALLKKNGCAYPVYQQFAVEGAPSSAGIPHAYVIDAKGKVVWNGNPYGDLNGFTKAIEEAAKSVPKAMPGSLVDGMDLTYCKDVARRLTAGQNAEGALRQLQARLAKGGPAAEEAKAIIARCDAWSEHMAGEIRENLETKPSKALAAGQLYLRTFPSKTAEFRDSLSKATKDQLTARLAASRQTLDKLRRANAATAGARKQLFDKAALQMRQLGTLTVEAGNADYQDVKALWEAFAAELKAE